MPVTAPDIENLSVNITHEQQVRSSIAATFAALLEEMGPANTGENGVAMPMVLEPWPGGRWFRDLGDQNGHFWGHVQAIKRPTLLEITGPLMMSFGVVSNVQYRLKERRRRDVDHAAPFGVRPLSGWLPRGAVVGMAAAASSVSGSGPKRA